MKKVEFKAAWTGNIKAIPKDIQKFKDRVNGIAEEEKE